MKPKRVQIDIQSYEGKIPPQSVDIEKAVLSSVLVEPQAFARAVAQIKTPEIFYKEQHKEIYLACHELFSLNQPVDLITVVSHLQELDKIQAVGGEKYLAEITYRHTSSANLEFYISILNEKHMLRKAIQVGATIIDEAYKSDADPFELINAASIDLMSVNSLVLAKDYQKVDTVSNKLLTDWKNKDEQNGILSGIQGMDEVITGFRPGNLVIIAGRPGMGKSVIGANIAAHAVLRQMKSVAVFTLEMSSSEILERIYSSETRIPSAKLKHKNLDSTNWEQIGQFHKTISQLNLFIDEQGGINFVELRAKATRIKQQHGLDMIIIDYLQLMKGAGRYIKREEEVSDISRNLKAIAKELDVPIIALAQLSREVEKTSDKIPSLAHLRESGSIEQDADIVMFVMRPEQYECYKKDNTFNFEEETLGIDGLAMLYIAKHRGGKLADIPLKFLKDYYKFEDLRNNYTGNSPYNSSMIPRPDFWND